MTEHKRLNPTVSVIIPAYNHEQFIGAAIDSVLAQTCDDFELIIVNDGSTDRTEEVIRSYDDPRIRYYSQENQDAFNTINRGMSLAKGRFLSILNSDDIYSLDRLEKILSFQKEHSSECVITDVVPISDRGEEFDDPQFGWNQWHQKNRRAFRDADDIYTAFLHGNFMVTTSNLFISRKAALQVGEFCSLRYLHDYDYIFRIMLHFPEAVHYMENDRLLYYRIHDGNTLGEAAIIGREQDQELIAKYMLKKIPVEYRAVVEAGAARLVELGCELHEVKMGLADAAPQGVVPAFKGFVKSLVRWLKKKASV
ncbi:MAG: hypothetical protein CSB23_02025 [Deltaproteobacteria bacterium]|nr:MAG: hypothetical protein CSB23_02025 [Deltaproteobacteria bacterium]